MATWSDLKIKLITTGDETGTWGETTNANFNNAIEQAITGSATITFTDANYVLTLVDSTELQDARALRLFLTGVVSTTRELTVPAIQKFYIIDNDLTNNITVKNPTGAETFTVPAGTTALVFSKGLGVVSAISYFTGALTSFLAVITGGTIDSTTIGATTASSGAFTTLAATSATLTNPLPVTSGGTGTATAFTTGSIPFAGASGTYTQDNTNFFWDDTNNRLGIGTSTPSQKLTINSNTVLPSAGAPATSTLWTVGADSAANVLSLDSFNSQNNIIVRRANGTAASPTALASGNLIFQFAARGYGATGYSTGGRAQFTFDAAENWTDTAQGTYIRFNTTQIGTTTLSERMRIHDSGGVSIGNTADPGATNLSVTGALTLGTDLAVADGGTGSSSITANSIILGNGTSALSGNLVAPGTSGNILTSDGTTWASAAKIGYINPVTLSGASTVLTTSIPATAKRITLLFNGVGSTGAVDWTIQIGTSSGLETTGYAYASSTAAGGALGGQSSTSTNGYTIRNNSAASPSTGFFTLTLMNPSTNMWLGNGQIVESFAPNGQINTSLGVKTLGGVLTRISILCGVSTWSSGSISLIYE